MNIWEYNYLEYLMRLANKKKSLENQLESYPKGWLATHKIRGYDTLYFHTYANGKRETKYLSPTKDAELIKQIEQRKKESPLIKEQIKFYQRIIKRNLPEVNRIISATPLPETTFQPQPSQNPNYPEHLSILTNRGEMVRSKSERFIADALYSFNLDYRYEQRLNLGGIIFHPDFTVISPLNGKIYYWEHLGLGDSNYIADWINRKHIYKEHNIEEGKNLIITTEEDKNRFKEIVATNFTTEKYAALKNI